MNVRIIRTVDVEDELIDDVVEILTSIPGPIKFLKSECNISNHSLQPLKEKVQEDEFHHMTFETQSSIHFIQALPDLRKVVSWDKLFKACRKYRKEYDIGDDEFVILLTGLSNRKNWFSAFDTKYRRDAFIQTTHWEFYIPGEKIYPVAFEIAANILQSRMFDSYEELLEKTHHDPVGCMNDISHDKKDITFKLRTGDICEDCQHIISDKKIDLMLVQQVFSIFNKIRSEMLYLQQFRMNLGPAKINIDMHKRALIFPDYDDTIVKLTPLEMSVYVLLIRNPKGITFPEFADHSNELEELYKELTTSANLVELKKNIANLAWNNDGSLSQKISNINRKLTIGLGDDMACFYRIQGAASEPRMITINRALVNITF